MTNSLELSALKKITWRIMPYVMLVYFIGFFDRINIGFAAMTMNQNLVFQMPFLALAQDCFSLGIS